MGNRAQAVSLADYLEESARRFPDRTAVVDPSGASLTYRELDEYARRVAVFLASRGVEAGDRVGLIVPKSIDGVTAIFGILKAGAAYVPADYTAPIDRNRSILSDGGVRAAFLDPACVPVLDGWPNGARPETIIIPRRGGTNDAGRDTDPVHHAWADVLGAAGEAPDRERRADNLAYILYTSGSTGIPKGVMLSHENATSFVDWCSSVFHPGEEDRFSSHAPFHFDLSVLDLYVSVKHGAALYLISEELGKNPKELARFISDNRLTVWYSTPSILSLLAQFGDLSARNYSALRLVLFAGEVFPVKHLRDTKKLLPHPVYYNLYGPTETNVCTFARIPDTIPDDRVTAYPIGWACSHCQPLVLDEPDGAVVAPGGEGLLYIAGPSVFQGYRNRPVENAAAFIERDSHRWYNTGDVVREDPEDGFIYLGRRDRMVKRHGYRIELGEIERAVYQHPQIREAAVVAVPAADSGVRIAAFLVPHAGARPSIIEMKTFCGSHLPAYMNPDVFVHLEALPRTSTDKVDYQSLLRTLQASV
jgi:amino acid adenylation domain-containing protein